MWQQTSNVNLQILTWSISTSISGIASNCRRNFQSRQSMPVQWFIRAFVCFCLQRARGLKEAVAQMTFETQMLTRALDYMWFWIPLSLVLFPVVPFERHDMNFSFDFIAASMSKCNHCVQKFISFSLYGKQEVGSNEVSQTEDSSTLHLKCRQSITQILLQYWETWSENKFLLHIAFSTKQNKVYATTGN